MSKKYFLFVIIVGLCSLFSAQATTLQITGSGNSVSSGSINVTGPFQATVGKTNVSSFPIHSVFYLNIYKHNGGATVWPNNYTLLETRQVGTNPSYPPSTTITKTSTVNILPNDCLYIRGAVLFGPAGQSSSGTPSYSNWITICSQSDEFGMTWEKKNTPTSSGVLEIGCGSGSDKCNPYLGDTACSVELPVLCTKELSTQLPTGLQSSQYSQWSGNVVATTEPVAPATEPLLHQSINEANLYCSNKFGTGWRVAEFHDGWAWNYKAYGNVGSGVSRFWVDINDQPANCWSH